MRRPWRVSLASLGRPALTLQMPETGSREYYQLLADLDDAAEAAREEGQALHEGDTAFYTL